MVRRRFPVADSIVNTSNERSDTQTEPARRAGYWLASIGNQHGKTEDLFQ